MKDKNMCKNNYVVPVVKYDNIINQKSLIFKENKNKTGGFIVGLIWLITKFI
jgi:hypothetical protein